MAVLRYLTAGESHGPALTGIIEGMPAGLPLLAADIDEQLARRQKGYGRGGRMQIETDRIRILSGVRFGYTLGSPISLQLINKDWENHKEEMAIIPPDTQSGLPYPPGVEPVTRPRPGHADLAGVQKYGRRDIRDILERASARETAMRVAVGAVARRLLTHFGMKLVSHVIRIGNVEAKYCPEKPEEISREAETSPVRCADPEASGRMVREVDKWRAAGDSVGGVFEVIVEGVPAGLGSHVHWDRRLDGLLAQAVMSIPAVKAVEIGDGWVNASRPGSQVHDEIFFEKDKGYYRKTNRAGGIEGGISNGSPLVVRAAMKPIPTLYKPLLSVDIRTKESRAAGIERSDVCAVPAAAVVGEAVVAWTVAAAFLEKFGGDSLAEVEHNYRCYLQSLQETDRRCTRGK